MEEHCVATAEVAEHLGYLLAHEAAEEEHRSEVALASAFSYRKRTKKMLELELLELQHLRPQSPPLPLLKSPMNSKPE